MKIWAARARIYARKAHAEALKIALAVVITEFVIVIGWYMLEKYDFLSFIQPKTIIIEITKKAEAHEIQPEAPKQPQEEENSIERIADTIYTLESSRGQNGYSKCKNIGKVNNIGYGIPGNGQYQCFKNHAEEMETLKSWIEKHQKEGMTEKDLLCHYSGNNYNICN